MDDYYGDIDSIEEQVEITEEEVLDKAMEMLEKRDDLKTIFFSDYPDLSAQEIALKLYEDDAREWLTDYYVNKDNPK